MLNSGLNTLNPKTAFFVHPKSDFKFNFQNTKCIPKVKFFILRN